MKNNYLNIYNNLIKLTRNKNLYLGLKNNDTFSDRLIVFFFHFGFFFNSYKVELTKKEAQNLFDFSIRQIELSIREIGYGDVSVNKKMKDYVNLFHSMVSEIHFWNNLSRSQKIEKFSIFLTDFKEIDYLLDYFELFDENLSKKTLNSYLKSVINP